jgi:hypothetical protein
MRSAQTMSLLQTLLPASQTGGFATQRYTHNFGMCTLWFYTFVNLAVSQLLSLTCKLTYVARVLTIRLHVLACLPATQANTSLPAIQLPCPMTGHEMHDLHTG